MFLTYGILIKVVLLVAGLGWCVAIVRRFPSDVSELREHYRKYKIHYDSDTLATMRTEERRRHYQENCASDFWTTFVGRLVVLLARHGHCAGSRIKIRHPGNSASYFKLI